MFNLEQSIVAWRQQMLAAGIQTPVPLEELEIHLREEIERQLQSGLGEPAAFENAKAQIGPARLLKTEFTKARGWFDFGSDNPKVRIQRRLAVLWFSYRCYELFTTLYLFHSIFPRIKGDKGMHAAMFLIEGFTACVLTVGIAGSVLLFFGKERGRWIIRTFALFSVTFWVGTTSTIILTGGRFSILSSAVLILSLVSIWLLRPPQKAKLANQ